MSCAALHWFGIVRLLGKYAKPVFIFTFISEGLTVLNKESLFCVWTA